MFTEKRARRLVDAGIKFAQTSTTASGIEVVIRETTSATARFANSEMTQHLQSVKAYIAVRAMVAGRSAVQYGDNFTESAVRQLVRKAIAQATELKHDARTYHLLKPDTPHTTALEGAPNRYDPRVAKITADDRRKAVQKIICIASSNGLKAAGIYAPSTTFHAIGNSNGLFRISRESSLECSVTALSATSSGWQKAFSPSLDGVNVNQLAQVASQKALQTCMPVAVPAKPYDVVLEPSAVLDLLTFLLGAFCGENHVDQTSVFAKKTGKRVLGKNITLRDDVYHPLQSGRDFDDEGMTRKVVTLIENGVFVGPVKSRRSAAYLGGAPTGHGWGLPASENEYALNPVLEGGDSTVQEMIESTERGILLPRVWYLRDVDPNTCSITGMTRDGATLIEHGKLTRGVKNMRFNISLIDLFKNVELLGEPVLAAGEEGSPAVVPALKVRNFRFTSRTK